jgi:hypothetical protein
VAGVYDAFIAKFHVPEYDNTIFMGGNNGDQRRWVTYYGGSGHDEASAVLAQGGHETGSVFVAGSAQADLVLGSTGFVQQYSGTTDAFIVELMSKTGMLLWATYLGGLLQDDASSLAMDGSGNLFVAGGTLSSGSSNNCTVPADEGFPMCSLVGGTQRCYQR